MESRVLIVDDEPLVARTLARLLARHDVSVAGDGATALSLCRGQEFGLVLLDLNMSPMSGVEVFQALTGELPDLARRVVFMTGGTLSDDQAELLCTVENPHVGKPFDIPALCQLVRERLAAS